MKKTNQLLILLNQIFLFWPPLMPLFLALFSFLFLPIVLWQKKFIQAAFFTTSLLLRYNVKKGKCKKYDEKKLKNVKPN